MVIKLEDVCRPAVRTFSIFQFCFLVFRGVKCPKSAMTKGSEDND